MESENNNETVCFVYISTLRNLMLFDQGHTLTVAVQLNYVF